jgi:transcriptional regulator with XRE-family HTH domain
MSKSLIGKIVKTLMFKQDLNTSTLARDIDLPQQTLSRIVSGASPNPHTKTLKPIAEFFNITVEQLKGEAALPDALIESNLPQTLQKASMISVIPWHDLEQYFSGSLDISPLQLIAVNANTTQSLFSTQLPDTSMAPYFPKAATLIFDRSIKPSDRHFILIKLADAETFVFRQLLIDGDQHYLKSMNPDLAAFPLRLLGEKDVIIAKMIEFRCQYDH